SSEAHQCAIASSLRLMGAPKGVIAPASTLAANALGLLRASPACVQIAEAAANKDDAWELRGMGMLDGRHHVAANDIAIVGMAVRVP
ncbi:hypothetical protein SB767_32485, partial [Bacillus sp. SIMBA_069]